VQKDALLPPVMHSVDDDDDDDDVCDARDPSPERHMCTCNSYIDCPKSPSFSSRVGRLVQLRLTVKQEILEWTHT